MGKFLVIPSEDDLFHHGIKGQKWGVRRYQNADGSYTSAGKQRYSKLKMTTTKEEAPMTSITSNGSKATSSKMTSVSKLASEETIKSAPTVLKQSGSIARSASNIASRSEQKRRQKKEAQIDVPEMSDKELIAAVNRMNLERNYRSLKAQSEQAGKVYLSDRLQTIGDVMAIGASAATILLAIQKLKG